MRHLSTSFALLMLAGGAATQVICERANENAAPTLPNPATSWFALKLTAQNAMAVSAVEFYLVATTTRQTMVGLYDEDPATGKPRTLLASAQVQLQAGVPAWRGAAFATPVPMLPNTNYFVAVQLGGGISPGFHPGGQLVTHYWSPPTWSGPFNTQRWMYRVYCGLNSAAFSTYGTGKAGSGTFVPAMAGLGFPNAGNPITLQLHTALAGNAMLLLWGRQASLATGVGTVYSFPIVLVTAGLTLGSGHGVGYVNTELDVPNDRSLAGAQVALQGWVLDAGAAQGIAHTNGLLMTIGQ